MEIMACIFFGISLIRENGKAKLIEVQSVVGEHCILQTDFTEEIKVLRKGRSLISQQGSQITLGLKKGETAILYEGQKPTVFNIKELTSSKESWNALGEEK